SQGNVTSATDALGIQATFTYTIANQPWQTFLPATGQQGAGQSSVQNTYLYPDGPLSYSRAYDESGTLIREVDYGYGLEGETLSVSGSAFPVTLTYDAAYRTKTVKDANGQSSGKATSYYYNTAGYLGGVTYPGYTGAAWPNLSGSDSVRFTSYDNNG